MSKSLQILTLSSFFHASLEVVDHLLDHGVIPDAVLLPRTFELLVCLQVPQSFQLCLQHWVCDVCRHLLLVAEASFLHQNTL